MKTPACLTAYRCHTILTLALAALLSSHSANAANQTWSGTTSGDWVTVGNWGGTNTPPGAITGTANGDAATFNSNPGNKTITIDSGRNIKNLTFDSAAAGAFTIGSAAANSGNALLLTTGGTILVNGTVTSPQTIDAPLTIQSAGGSYTLNANGAAAGLLNINGNISAAVAGTSTLSLIGGNGGLNTLTGVIGNGSATTFDLTKSGGGQWVLSAANTYTGTTTISQGTLTLSGSAGAILNSSGVTILGGTLKLDNATAGNTDRFANSVPLNLSGGTFNFAVNTAAGSFSETVGTLNLNAAGSNIASGQAASGQTSVLTFGTVNRSAGGGINFSGSGLGNDGRNQVLFTAPPILTNGIVAAWATTNNADFATYGANGVTTYAGYTNLNALGSTIADDSTSNVKLTAAGSGGNIALAATTTSVNTLLQGINTTATVDTDGKVLRTSGIMIGTGKNSLSIGTSAGSGTLTALTSGGELVLNASANTLTINSVIADNTSASSTTKLGANTVVLAANNTSTGPTNISAGTLQIGSAGTTGSIGGDVTLSTGATLAYNRSDSASPIAGALTGTGGNINVNSGTLTLNPTNLAAGATNTFGFVTMAANASLVINASETSTNTFAGINFNTNSKVRIAGGVNTFNGSNWPSQPNGIYISGGTNAISLILPYAGAYAYLGVSGGSTKGALSLSRNGLGVMDVSGGTYNVPSGGGGVALAMAGGTSTTSVINQTGGSFVTTNGGQLILCNGAGARGEFNLAGGTMGGLGAGGAYSVSIAGNATATGILNLKGGTFYASAFGTTLNLAGAFINFNGGTLAAIANSATFWGTNSAKGYIYSGGATIDDSGFAVTIAQPLLAPTGQGVTALPALPGGALSGYVGAPYVAITGGTGGGATGVATFDAATGQVTGITLTNPGTGYAPGDTLNVTLKGGGVADLNLGSATLGANTSGGLTKIGSGTLTLSGANTYTGGTTVSAGTLRLASPNANNESSTIAIAASGATLQLDFAGTDTVGQLVIGSNPPLANGVYGGPDSDAPNEIFQLSGIGTITVSAAAAANNYAAWATANGITGQPASGDFDKDGLTNLVEYALGKSPTVSSQPAGTLSAGVITFTKGSDAIANNDVIFEIEESTDLGISDPWATVVTEGTADDTTTISYTLPTGVAKEFARLKITQIP